MANGPTKLTPLTLPTKTIQTPRLELFYDIPHSPEGDQFDVIPVEFLRSRAQYAIDCLEKRLGVTTVKHHVDRKAEVLANINDFRRQIGKIIDNIPSIGVTNTVELRNLCRRIGRTVIEFKGDRERNLDVGQKVSEIFFRIERDIIHTLFDLPSPKLPEKPLLPDQEQDALKKLSEAKAQIEAIIKLHSELNALLQPLEDQSAESGASLETLIEFTPLQALIDILQNPENLEQIPKEVKDACVKEFEKYRSALLVLTKFAQALSKIKVLLHGYDDDQLNRLRGAFMYFEGLISFGNRRDLGEKVASLKELEPDFKKAADYMKRATATVRRFIGDADLITDSPEIKRVAAAVLVFAPCKNGTNGSVLDIFKAEEPAATTETSIVRAVPADVEVAADVSGRIASESTVVPHDKSGGEADQTNKGKRKLFRWKSATPEQAKNEVRRRVFGCEKFTILAYLFEMQRWNDLRKMLEKLTSIDLMACGLNNSVMFAQGSVYRTNDNLFRTCFPEAYREGSEPVTIAGGRSATKFYWNRKGITSEEIKAEIKSRLFEGWPLIQDLAEKGKWPELMQLLDKMNSTDLLKCRIADSVIGENNAPYATKENMFKDVFPEAYTNVDEAKSEVP